MLLCVATETRPLDRLGQLGEFEQDSNTDSELESNTDSVSAAVCVGDRVMTCGAAAPYACSWTSTAAASSFLWRAGVCSYQLCRVCPTQALHS